MGWQERDYASRPGRSVGGPFGRRGAGGGIWGGSIVKKLIVANIVMFLLCYMTPLGPTIRGTSPRIRQVVTNQGVALVMERDPGLCEMITTKVLHGQVWRLVTSQYLHAAGMAHILFNMIGLLFLGQALERVWGNRKFLVVYTISGVCGNLVLMAAGLAGWINPNIPALGASGCILGLLGAAAVMFPHAEVYVYMLFPIKIRTAAILFGLMYVYNVYSQGANYGGDLCHLAGLAFGGWWAWRGEAWWVRSGWSDRLAGVRVRSARPTRAPRRPGPWVRKMHRRTADQQEVDRILKKVYDGGIHTLTPAEKRTLAEATERQRQEDLQARRGE